MARPEGSPAPSSTVAVAVRVDGRKPYAMFELVTLTTVEARLRGPLLLELGEQLTLGLSRHGRTVEVEGKITAVTRGDDHADPETTVELAEGAAALITPLL